MTDTAEIELAIFVKTNAKRSALVAVKDRVLHIALHAKPHDGEANAELIRFLAELLQIPKSRIQLCRGHKSRNKVVSLPLNDVVRKLIFS